MTSEWEIVSLGDYCEIKNGYAFKSKDFSTSGVPVIKIKNVKPNQIVESDFSYIPEDIALEKDKWIIRKGDILLTMTGNRADGSPESWVGKAAIFTLDGKYLLNQRVASIRSKSIELDTEYLGYFLSSWESQLYFIKHSNSSGGQANISPDIVRQYLIPLPPLAVQKRMVSVLKVIDEMISANQQINDNLQQQAELLYHERFETADRSNLPVGWRIVRLGDVATISKKSFNPAKEPEMLLEHYSIPAFDEAHFPVFELSTAIKSNKFVVDNTCFMISKLNPTTKRVWKPYCLTENAVCSTEFIVYKANRQEITDFLYSVIDSSSFSDFMCSHVTGSTGSRQRTTPSDTLAFELILPTAEEIAEYQGIVSPIFEQIKCNAIENDELKRLRDSLLPKLMSGEIDASGIQL